jgi:hypothetical protein
MCNLFFLTLIMTLVLIHIWAPRTNMCVQMTYFMHAHNSVSQDKEVSSSVAFSPLTSQTLTTSGQARTPLSRNNSYSFMTRYGYVCMSSSFSLVLIHKRSRVQGIAVLCQRCSKQSGIRSPFLFLVPPLYSMNGFPRWRSEPIYPGNQQTH